jgi:YesN/AraC family two-component response regulator
MENKLFIKNMVCDRCKMAVQKELENASIPFQSIELGEVTLSSNPTSTQLEGFRDQIMALGFELIEDKSARIISQIKNAVLQYVRENPSSKKLKFSVFLGEKLVKDYNYLSSLFSEIEGTTIEQFLIHQKIERVKELLVYDELSLSQIAYELGYSSVQHLSNQFKKVTGLTPSYFKQVKENKRKPLDKV